MVCAAWRRPAGERLLSTEVLATGLVMRRLCPLCTDSPACSDWPGPQQHRKLRAEAPEQEKEEKDSVNQRLNKGDYITQSIRGGGDYIKETIGKR
jgi:hypothetical protein